MNFMNHAPGAGSIARPCRPTTQYLGMVHGDYIHPAFVLSEHNYVNVANEEFAGILIRIIPSGLESFTQPQSQQGGITSPASCIS